MAAGLLLLTLLGIISSVSGQIQQSCNSTTFTIQANDPVLSLYTDALLASNQNCTFTFVFADGATGFVNVQLTSLNTLRESAVIFNDFGSQQSASNGELLTSGYWPAKVSVRIVTSEKTTAKATISVRPEKVNNLNPMPITVNSPFVPPLVYRTPFVYQTSYVFYSSTKSVLSFVTDNAFPLVAVSTFVYDGRGTSAKLVGTLDNFKTHSFTSSGNYLTLYTPGGFHNGVVIVNDQRSVAQYSNQNYYWSYTQWPALPFQTVTLDASRGPASMTIVNDVPFTIPMWPILTDIDFGVNTGSTIRLYDAFPYQNMPSGNFLFSYSSKTVKQELSQRIPTTQLTLVLDQGIANVTFSCSLCNYTTDWGMARIGRSGYFFSDNYGVSQNHTGPFFAYMNDMDSHAAMKHFTITTKNNTFSSANAYLTIYGSIQGSNYFDPSQSVNYSNPNGGTFSANGRSLQIVWSNGVGPDNGQMLRFEIRNKAASSLSLITILLLVVSMLH